MAKPVPEKDLRAPQGIATLLPMLFDFAATPGRFSIALREPRVAFDNIQTVLMLACGRKLDAVPLGGASEADVRRVARYFVRTALLRPGADYYTLMGVQPGFAETTLREHYRLLMRLSHPDFATPGQAWPADAATRINQANDVLSSSVRRHEYDATVAPASVARPQAVMAAAGTMSLRRVPLQPRTSLLVKAGGGMTSLFAGAAKAIGSISFRKLLGGVRFPRLGSNAATMVLASVLAAVGGSAMTMWWMQDGASPAGKLAASNGSAVPDVVNTASYGPTLSSTVALELPADFVDKPGDRKPIAEVAQTLPQQVDHTPPLPRRAIEAPLARNEGVFQFSFTTPGTRIPDAAPRQAPPVQTFAQRPQQPQALTRASTPPPAQMQQAQVSQPTSPEPAFIARSAPPPPPAPAPVAEPAVATTVAAAAPSVVAPISPPAPLPAAVAATAPRLLPKFSLADVQPTLAGVIGAMQTGRAENVLQMVDASSRRSDGAAAFSDAYNRTVSGAKSVQLGKVSLSSVPLDDQLVVDGTVQLMVMDFNSVTTSKDLYIRAWFVARAGNPVLTRLSATPGRQ